MPAVLEYAAQAYDEGRTAETLLKTVFGVSSGLMKELKLGGRIFINGNVCRSIDRVRAGDLLTASVEESCDGGEIAPCEMDMKILFEDDYITVINKPGGISSHPSMNNRTSTLANGVMYHWLKNGETHGYHIVNRLDKDTSGLCVVAKNRYAHSRLAEQMKNNEFARRYTAIVHGVPKPLSGRICVPIKRENGSVIKRVAAPDGRYAETLYQTAEVIGDNFSMVNFELKTGRTHQIRVHFSHIGHPLVGDWLYGNGDCERTLISRQALHAGELIFKHPLDCREMKFSTEIPDEMKELLVKIKFLSKK